MRLVWDKHNEAYDRVYVATGVRGTYRIDLDKAADRWTVYLNGERCVENVYYVTNAQKIAETFESEGVFALPVGLRPRPDGQTPHLLLSTSPILGQSETPVRLNASDSSTATLLPISGAIGFLAPSPEALADKLLQLIADKGITPEQAGTAWLPWRSGVYALIDCVFSSQSNYNSVVLPALNRLSLRPGLNDRPDLSFSEFLADVDGFGRDKYEQYAVQVLTRNKIAGRLKVEICSEAAHFFVDRGLETMADLHAIGSSLEPLILNDFQANVHGVGPALSHYLLTLFGDEDHVKLDVMITRFWGRMSDWCPRQSNEHDYRIVHETFRIASSQMASTPARLDNAIWRYESTQSRL